ncbi:restriction endonuclease subunit S [Heyndrickxia coagulans]|uniref:restriction endonuclease subunit S n=1 Tax=Heyndrickxia coagulans TaxID=1398 RepID=UPI003F59C536
MMEQKNLVPKRRFKEFQNTSAWEQRKLGKVVKTHQFRPYLAEPNAEGDFEVIQQGDRPVAGYTNGTPFENYRDVTLFGDHTVSLYKPTKPFFIATDGVKILSADGLEGDFLFSLLERYKPEPQGYKRHFTILKNQGAWITKNVEEQVKIGAFFKNLDHLITLHQCKLEKMKTLKSAYLSEMFPAEGERVPKRRFAGFTQAWEQRKFIELLDVKDGIRRGPFGSALKKDLFVPKSDYVVYEQQNAIYDKWETRYYITKEKFEELHKFVLSEGDFIMSGAGTIGRIAKVPKGIKKGVFNQALIRFKINPELTDSNYFLEWIRSNEMQRKFTGSNPGSAMTNLVPMSEVKEWVISLPSLAEQKKIGDFFAELSDIITLHQRKLEKLQNIKKAYLNEMFV